MSPGALHSRPSQWPRSCHNSLTPPPWLEQADRDSLEALSRKVWSSWGQQGRGGTREVREKETRDVLNKTLRPQRCWYALRSRKVMSAHGREEVEPSPVGANVAPSPHRSPANSSLPEATPTPLTWQPSPTRGLGLPLHPKAARP